MDFSVDKIAGLAYLELSDSERLSFEKQFKDILLYVDQLQKVPMSAAEAASMGAFHILTAFYERFKLDPSVSLREEVDSEETLSLVFNNDEALSNAPQTGGLPGELLYAVPSIIEK